MGEREGRRAVERKRTLTIKHTSVLEFIFHFGVKYFTKRQPKI